MLLEHIMGPVDYGDHGVLLDLWLTFSQACNQMKKMQGGYGLWQRIEQGNKLC